ncbi:histidine kinase [Leifsonia sp. PS1209]|uniref:sensor histidine kinase n=1 Tax=Leifsonia sp. PS1209 TaxID=2724914 RepID=UPI001442C739|nr:histidine kinase [Leifsonia sp. PS1209]QIZ99941.1 sensor histidine kinase [Leifsonia sp. PS1209]
MTSASPRLLAAPASEWHRPAPDARGRRADVVLAVVLTAAMIGSVFLYQRTGMYGSSEAWVSIVWAVASGAPLAVRRRWPEAVAICSAVAFWWGGEFRVGEYLFSNIALFIAVYTLGAWGRRRTLATVLRLAIIAAMFVWLFWNLIVTAGISSVVPELSREGTLSPYVAFGLIQIIINLLYFGGAYYFGDAAFRSARARHELETLTLELAEERERTQQQAIALERVRIARELHDVVAHHVSVMGVQAGAARLVLDRDPAAARSSLLNVESSARTAVDELRLLLGALRDDQAAPAGDAATTHGVDQLGELVDDAVCAGLPTRLHVIGSRRAVPATIGLCVYRVAQEALTNTRKHGGAGATAELRLRYTDDSLEVEASDTGLGAGRSATASGAGMGHLGMRERVASVGGSIEIGPRSRGGYLVRARFPLAAEVTR